MNSLQNPSGQLAREYSAMAGTALGAPTAATPLNLTAGLSNLETLAKRMYDIDMRLSRILAQLGETTNRINDGPAPSPSPPYSEMLIPRLFDVTRAAHQILSSIEDKIARVELTTIG